MASAESQLIVAFREEMRTGFAVFATEMRQGLSQVSDRLDRTNELLVETRTELHEMKEDMSSKLTGISNLLIQSEKSHNKTDRRLDDLEARMKNLENQKKRQ